MNFENDQNILQEYYNPFIKFGEVSGITRGGKLNSHIFGLKRPNKELDLKPRIFCLLFIK